MVTCSECGCTTAVPGLPCPSCEAPQAEDAKNPTITQSVCMHCHLPLRGLELGDADKLSHGLCQKCLRERYPAGDD